MAVDPRGADLKRYLAEDPGGPVVMLNLLRFQPDGGRARYDEYVEHFRRTAEPFGAEVLYVGDGSTALVAEDGPGVGRRAARALPEPAGVQRHGARPGVRRGDAPAHARR